MARSENLCPQLEFIRALSKELGVSQAIAKHIYTVYYVTVLRVLKDYDTVCVTPFLKMYRKTPKEKLMYNMNTGEYVMTEPKEKFYARIATRYQTVESFDRFLDDYEDKLRKQEQYEIQEEQERQEREAEREAYKEEQRRLRRNKRRRTKYRKMKDRERVRAIERMIHYEGILESHEKERYRRELERRKKGYK